MAEQFDYIESQADADELLREFGQVGAIRRFTNVPGPNPWDPPIDTTVDYPVTLAVLPIDLKDTGRDIDGTLIKSTDLQILASVVGLPFAPSTTDILLINGAMVDGGYVGGSAYIVLRNNTLAPAGVPVLHDMIVTA